MILSDLNHDQTRTNLFLDNSKRPNTNEIIWLLIIKINLFYFFLDVELRLTPTQQIIFLSLSEYKVK